MFKLDAKNRKILALLDMNARMPIGELAKRAAISRQVATYRLDKMQREGAVLGALTIFDSAVAGNYWYRVLLRLGNAKSDVKKRILKHLANHDHAAWVGEVGGNWDIVVNFVAKDNHLFNDLFEEFLHKYGRYVLAYETLVYVDVRDQRRAYMYPRPLSEEHMEFYHEMRFDPTLKLDDVDKKLIRILSRNVFTSFWKIASKIGVSDKTVSARIKRMEEKGLILGYRFVVHPSTLGYESYMVFLGINNLQKEREAQLHNFLRASPNAVHVVKHFGRWRIGMEVETKDRKEFQDFLVRLRSEFGDIISDFETFPIFKDHLVNYFPEGALV